MNIRLMVMVKAAGDFGERFTPELKEQGERTYARVSGNKNQNKK